jgi:glyoxylase-like metal-dependent hydrolase (beta-lactamase superfamily II)
MLAYRDVLFISDLFSIKNGTPQLFPRYLMWNMEAERQSLALLKSLEFHWLCPAHGQPLQRNDVVERFIRRH